MSEKPSERLKAWYVQFEKMYDDGYIDLDQSFERLMKIIASVQALESNQIEMKRLLKLAKGSVLIQCQECRATLPFNQTVNYIEATEKVLEAV